MAHNISKEARILDLSYRIQMGKGWYHSHFASSNIQLHRNMSFHAASEGLTLATATARAGMSITAVARWGPWGRLMTPACMRI